MAKPLTDTIPTDRAWKEGRRIYIRCGYQSRTNTDLRNLGAHWDADARALWIGSGKAAQVIAILTAAAERVAAVEAVKATATAANLWVTIPFEASAIREQAKQLGARWDRIRKQWALPTAEAHATISGEVAAYQQAETAARTQAEAARKQEAADRAKATAEADARHTAERAQTALARSGRTLTGETTQLVEVTTRRMNRATADASARPIGSIVRLPDGRRAIITGVRIWFTNDDMASSACWHAETHDEAHWDFRYDLAIVEPTAEETAHDDAEAAARADETEMASVFAAMEKAPRTEAGETESWSTVTGPKISRRAGSFDQIDDGQIILDGDRAIRQHPGYYDDYRRSELATTDPALVGRVRAIIEAGDRVVGSYTVKVSA
jgi:hypothetical protein